MIDGVTWTGGGVVNTEATWTGVPLATGPLLGPSLRIGADKAKWTLVDETGKVLWSSDVPPEVEAREAVERQRKDEADRQERAADATRALYSELIQGGRFVAEKALDRGPDLIRALALLVVAAGAALVPVTLTIEAVLR